MSNQNNRMYYNNNNQNSNSNHQQYHLNNGSNLNNNNNNSQGNNSQQQQTNHAQMNQQQFIQQHQYNEQLYVQAMQQQQYHQIIPNHQQNSGIVQPPPGLSFMQSAFPQNQAAYGQPHFQQQVYSQQQQQSLMMQQQQQGNSASVQNNTNQQTQHNSGSNQQYQQSQQSHQQNQQLQQQNTQQSINSNQVSSNNQMPQQGKLAGKLQKQYSLADDRVTQASEEERSISSYQQSISSNSQGEEYLLEHLELNKFKIHPCPNQNVQHNHKQCQYYHGLKDRRRVGTNYSQDSCQFIDSFGANCPLGDNCPKSHNKVEQLYRPDKYKTKFCTYYPNNCKSCEYGIFCSFAHSENDINTELIHNYEYDVDFYIFYYKTVWCPFNYINHDRGMCVYAHNCQDYRRKPHSVEFGYEPDGCESWDPNSFIIEYEIGCPNKQNCKKCHGWKELEYHPKIYRTKPCQQQPCPKGKACPYYHNISEKRYAPRNRITKGLFKASQHLIPKEIKQAQQPGGNNNPPNSGNGNVSSTSKIAQFNSSHSLSSQNTNPIGNYQGYQDSIIVNTQPVKKQTSLNNNKKPRGNNVLMKMNTCNDLSSNMYEDQGDGDRQYVQFQSTYQEKVMPTQILAHSPPIKKMGSGGNNSSNSNNFKRSESQQFEESATSNSTPQPPNISGFDEQKKPLKMAVPFNLEDNKDSGKKKNGNNETTQQQNSSSNKQNSIQQQNSQEYVLKEQIEQIYDQFDNAFTPQHPGVQRNNPSNQIQAAQQTNPFQNQQQYNMQYESPQSYNIPPNNQNFQPKRVIYSKQNSIQSNNNNSFNNLDTIQQQKPQTDKQYDEDYDQINALIHNIL